MLKIATWNVNSLRVRLPQLLDWLNRTTPDIVALQETKITDEQFPWETIQAAGYHAIFSGQKSYNGVALLSRIVGQEIVTDFPRWVDSPRRLLGATYQKLRVLNLYIPNGAMVYSDKYQYKLNWLQHLQYYVEESLKQYTYLIVLGDFNIAPEDSDLHDPETWQGGIMVSKPEREALQKLFALGLYDTFRLFEQPPQTFSWWDYRTRAFQRNHGVRIDLILASQALANACTTCLIDINLRRLPRPSDHAPVIATFNLSI